MMTAIFRDNAIDQFDTPTYRQSDSPAFNFEPKKITHKIHTIRSKIVTPPLAQTISRPRLDDLLLKSSTQFAATLVTGRAGSGKTALASNFVQGHGYSSSWFTLDTADGDWEIFTHYFWHSLFGARAAGRRLLLSESASGEDHVEFIADITARFEQKSKNWPDVIVLDGIHHLFDSEWFSHFFNLLIASLPVNVHLLMLCRSKPPNPLWRLRSKQVLNVVDEKLLAFSLSEAEDLFVRNGWPREQASQIHRVTFGRAEKLIRAVESAIAGASGTFGK